MSKFSLLYKRGRELYMFDAEARTSRQVVVKFMKYLRENKLKSIPISQIVSITKTSK